MMFYKRIGYMIFHGFQLDIIFIEQVVCFLSPSLGMEIEAHNKVDKYHIQPLTIGILFITFLSSKSLILPKTY